MAGGFKDETVPMSPEALLEVARALNVLVVSLDKIGSAFSLRDGVDVRRQERGEALNQWLDGGAVFQQVSDARERCFEALEGSWTGSGEALDLALADDATEGNFWSPRGRPVEGPND